MAKERAVPERIAAVLHIISLNAPLLLVLALIGLGAWAWRRSRRRR